VEVEGRLSGDFESEHASDARRSAASTANKALDFIAHLRLSKTCFRIVRLSPSAEAGRDGAQGDRPISLITTSKTPPDLRRHGRAARST
jgi:hypothetical protein